MPDLYPGRRFFRSDWGVVKIQDRFHLEMTEEEAIRSLEALIADGLTAVMPQVLDRIHGLVQNIRG